MQKDFDKWNIKKKQIDGKTARLYFRQGEIWWVNLGLNIGFNNEKSQPSEFQLAFFKICLAPPFGEVWRARRPSMIL